jgi:hypothetical protein
MAGLKGLIKGERPSPEVAADHFIRGAQERVVELSHKATKSDRTFQRYTFSLTADVSEKIDQISLIPRQFRSSRSDVIKAAIELLVGLPESDVIAALDKIR